MVTAIGDLVGEKSATDLANQLKEVWEIEQLYGELQGLPAPERSRRLETLDQTAGLFPRDSGICPLEPVADRAP